MPKKLVLHADRLFPADPAVRAIARRLYGAVQDLPIISPHGHTDPAWFADNEPFGNAAELLLAPDHYLYRMLYSQGIALTSLGVPNSLGDRLAHLVLPVAVLALFNAAHYTRYVRAA